MTWREAIPVQLSTSITKIITAITKSFKAVNSMFITISSIKMELSVILKSISTEMKLPLKSLEMLPPISHLKVKAYPQVL